MPRLLSAVLLLLLLLAAACGGDDPDPTGASEPADDAVATEATDPGDAEDDAVEDDTADDAATDDADDATTEVADGAGAACTDVDLSTPPAEPTTIRFGHGTAAEEPFLLMTVSPELTEHQGTFYEMEMSSFRGSAETLVGLQSGDFDAVSSSTLAQIRGVAAGALDIYAIATVAREGEPDAFSTSLIALEGSGITGPDDLVGRTIGINDLGSVPDFLARLAIQQAGGDPDTDATYVVFPFPSQEEALRGGQVEVASVPEPFFTLAQSGGDIVKVADVSDLTDFAYDLLTISFARSFVEEHLEVVCAWVADYQATMNHYRESTDEARRALAATDFVSLPEDVYLTTGDYARPADAVVDTEGMGLMLDAMVEVGILTEDERIDPETLVLPGVSAGH